MNMCLIPCRSYAARYLAGETYRRRIARHSNKGENLHALRRPLAHASVGELRRRAMSSRRSRYVPYIGYQRIVC